MSDVEEHLVRDIAAVTRGVVVSDADLREARDAIDDRIVARQRRNRRLAVGAAAALVAVVGILGYEAFRSLGVDEGAAPPANSASATPDASPAADPYASFLVGAAPTPDLVNGVWRVDNGILLIRFSVLDRSPDEVSFDNGGELYSDPRVQGTFGIVGSLITVKVTGGRAGCDGQTFAVRASLPSAGAMRFVFTDPGTGSCLAGAGEQWELEQVLPTGEALSGVGFQPDEPGWGPVEDAADLHGVWMADGGGYVLELNATGSYYVAGESGEPVDLGEWSLQGTELTLTTTPDWRQCEVGDRLVLRDVELAFGTATRGLRGTVAENLCGGPWATKSWVWLPDG